MARDDRRSFEVTRRLYYGWFDRVNNMFRLSLYAPDAPVRPSLEVATKAEAIAYAERKRADVYWWPPLPGETIDVR
jgi:hypothetical protein